MAPKKKKTAPKSFTHQIGKLQGTHGQFSNVSNRFQGTYKRALFLCSAGLLRSATAAHVFSAEPYNWNTRTAGVELSYALNPVNGPLLVWADIIYCMEPRHSQALLDLFPNLYPEIVDKIRILNIPDHFRYRDVELVQRLQAAIDNVSV